MTTLQIELVQSSFESVKPIAEVAADLFYARLFELDPSLRAMFRTDRAEQGRKLMLAIRRVRSATTPAVSTVRDSHLAISPRNADAGQ
jgi:hypothetical protein